MDGSNNMLRGRERERERERERVFSHPMVPANDFPEYSNIFCCNVVCSTQK